jgi:monoterpene epsilon-lactone hydrolase
MPSAEHEAFVSVLTSAPAPEGTPTLQEQRDNYRAMLTAHPIADDILIEETSVAGCAADWVTAPNSSADRAILYLHGGGYMIGDNVAYREFASRLARATSSRVCVLDYRLGPEHACPAALEDTVTAFQQLLSSGYDPANLVIAGDSAGGGLAIAALMDLRDGASSLPGCAIAFSPWTDLEMTGESIDDPASNDPFVAKEALVAMANAYAPDEPGSQAASPLNGDCVGLPPIHIETGTREILLSDSRRFVEKAKAAGVEVDYHEGVGLVHVWPVVVPDGSESAEALERCGAFVGRHCD